MVATMKTHMQHVRDTWGTPGHYVAEVWGSSALWDLTPDGRSILIHLDRPDAGTRARRLAEHAAKTGELAAADCPLCQHMAEFGGDEIYDDHGPIEPGNGRDAESRAGTAGLDCLRPVAPVAAASGPLPPVARARPAPEPATVAPEPAPAPATARIPAAAWLHPATIRAIRAAGARAIGAVAAACGSNGSSSWSRSGVEQAAQWLADGDRRAAIARPWPMLAARLRKALELTPRFTPGVMLDADKVPR